jgi:hypothetical protein
MSIRGVTFDKQKVKSQDDGLAGAVALVNQSCILSGCEVSQNGASAVSINTGAFFVCGRLVYVTVPETIGIPSVPAGQTLYIRVVFEVDLNQTNTETEFLQGRFKVLSDSAAYPGLIEEDINLGGTLHQMPFAKLRADAAGIISGSFADERVPYYAVSSLKQEIDGKAPGVHTHDERYYTESETDAQMAGKAEATHTHTIGNVTNLQTTLDGKAATSHTHTSLSSLNVTGDVGTGSAKVVNVYIGSGSPPSASSVPRGTLFIKYV